MTTHADKRSVHTDALETLGTIIGPEEKRDAIHIAVENVVAAGILRPGEDVGFLPDGTVSSKAEKLVGIVDPFLKDYVEKGQRFWLLVYPRQIKSLRHVWTHPDFPDEPEAVAQPKPAPRAKKVTPAPIPTPDSFPRPSATLDTLESERAVQSLADQFGLTSEELLEAADRYVKYGKYLIDGGRFEGEYVPDSFWPHYEVLRGVYVPESQRNSFFSCSC